VQGKNCNTQLTMLRHACILLLFPKRTIVYSDAHTNLTLVRLIHALMQRGRTQIIAMPNIKLLVITLLYTKIWCLIKYCYMYFLNVAV
jgi:hypothetical protein